MSAIPKLSVPPLVVFTVPLLITLTLQVSPAVEATFKVLVLADVVLKFVVAINVPDVYEPEP